MLGADAVSVGLPASAALRGLQAGSSHEGPAWCSSIALISAVFH